MLLSGSSLDASELAAALYHKNFQDTPVTTPRLVAEFLGDFTPLSEKTRRLYFGLHFEFSGLGLLDSFRILASNLLLSGETHKIDRVLRSFAQRYHECLAEPLTADTTEVDSQTPHHGPDPSENHDPLDGNATPEKKANETADPHMLSRQKNVPPSPTKSSSSGERLVSAVAVGGVIFANVARFFSGFSWSPKQRGCIAETQGGSPKSCTSKQKSEPHDSQAASDTEIESEYLFWSSFRGSSNCVDVLHLIVFSMLLLTTDMRGVRENRMTRLEFLSNTTNAVSRYDMGALFSCKLCKFLEVYFDGITALPLESPREIDLESCQSAATTTIMGHGNVAGSKDSVKSTRTTKWGAGGRLGSAKIFRCSINSIRTAINSNNTNTRANQAHADEHDVIKQQSLRRKALQVRCERAGDRSWRSCVLQMTAKKLIMASGSRQLAAVENVHCFARNIIDCTELDYMCSRKYVFVLYSHDGDVILFECQNQHDVEYWVRAINVVNAQSTSATDVALLSSVFGWEFKAGLERRQQGGGTAKPKPLSRWIAPPQNMRISLLPLIVQRKHLREQLGHARENYVAHIELHSNVLSIYAPGARQLALCNWQRRFEHLRRESTKWQIYVGALGPPQEETAPAPPPVQMRFPALQCTTAPRLASIALSTTGPGHDGYNCGDGMVLEDYERNYHRAPESSQPGFGPSLLAALGLISEAEVRPEYE